MFAKKDLNSSDGNRRGFERDRRLWRMKGTRKGRKQEVRAKLAIATDDYVFEWAFTLQISPTPPEKDLNFDKS